MLLLQNITAREMNAIAESSWPREGERVHRGGGGGGSGHTTRGRQRVKRRGEGRNSSFPQRGAEKEREGAGE